MHYKILEQYPEFVVVLKHHGVLSVPSRDANESRPVLGRLLQEQLNQQIFPVHRLDFEVAGIMLYALTASMHRILSMAFEEHKIRKTYLALGSNFSTQKGSSEWRSHLQKGKKRAYEAPFGKPSITIAEVLENIELDFQQISKWSLSPLTGRSHQLRYEMSKHGHPIVGDKLYGSTLKILPQQIALISTSLTLPAILNQPPYNLPKTLSLNENQINQLLPHKITLDI